MNEQKASWEEIERIVEELIEGQKGKLLQCGRRLVPYLTPEDLLQPNDFPELEYHPYFRYEEGLLAGLQSVQMALWALKKSSINPLDEVKS
ncbi:hypothetical protein [Candidatus Protochlamydia phocaeensis]|uniref:hypothetical protein n=1 Tax=Candidatus Protochlamydia phocaeensis TaxID=1414722 RepID=UPI000838E368|nr:hypothetical protein [Candidatus Protochlamydia phocaeensis]